MKFAKITQRRWQMADNGWLGLHGRASTPGPRSSPTPRGLPHGNFPIQQAASPRPTRPAAAAPAGCNLDLWLLYYAAVINIARPQTGRVGDATDQRTQRYYHRSVSFVPPGPQMPDHLYLVINWGALPRILSAAISLFLNPMPASPFSLLDQLKPFVRRPTMSRSYFTSGVVPTTCKHFHHFCFYKPGFDVSFSK